MGPSDIKDIWGRKASQIDDNLWQSGFPYPFDQVPKSGVDVIVLTATDAQPDKESLDRLKRAYPKLGGILCPFDDVEDRRELKNIVKIADRAADKVVAKLAAGKNVLVTCAVGRNRSGLVSALTLVKKYGMTGAEALARVRERRNPSLPAGEGALMNKAFADYLANLGGR